MGDRVNDDTSKTWLTRDRDAGRDADARSRLTYLLDEIRYRVLTGAQLRPGQTVLDLGAGTGMLASEALEHVSPKGTVIALDQSQPALMEIRTRPGSHLYRVGGDAHRIPLGRSTIDVVLARSVLIYLDDLSAALDEIARVLRPGGRLSVFEPINSRRRHDANLVGMTVQELAAIEELRVQSSAAAPAMMAFNENRLMSAVTAAGLIVGTLQTEWIPERLDNHDAVDAYLNRPPHPGSPAPIAQVTASLGATVATRYKAAWHHAFEQATPGGGITFSTPVLYLTAVLPQ